MIALGILVIGLILIVFFADQVIRHAIKLSTLLGINEIVFGFIFIAVSTSLPELSIAFTSSLSGNGEISLGNVIGASIINLTLIFGVLAGLKKFTLQPNDVKEIIRAISLVSLIAFALVFLNQLWWGFAFLCGCAFFIYVRSIANIYQIEKFRIRGLRTLETIKSLLAFFISVAVVIISAEWIVKATIEITKAFGLFESLIGASIIALGTTLPELSVALSALRKNKISMIVGNSMGSIVANSTLIISVAGLVNPIVLSPFLKFLAVYLLLTSLLFIFVTSTMRMDKKSSFVFLSCFVLYVLISIYFQSLYL
jgi:cation:H+ antiporter